MRKFTLTAIVSLLASGVLAGAVQAATSNQVVPPTAEKPSANKWYSVNSIWGTTKIADPLKDFSFSNQSVTLTQDDVKAFGEPGAVAFTAVYFKENFKNWINDKGIFNADASKTISLNSNNVSVKDVTVREFVGLQGRTSAGTVEANNNTITVDGLTLSSTPSGNKVVGIQVTGDYRRSKNVLATNASGNNITFSNLNIPGDDKSAARQVVGVLSNFAQNIEATNNNITVSGSTIAGKEVFGVTTYSMNTNEYPKPSKKPREVAAEETPTPADPENHLTVKGNSLTIKDTKFEHSAKVFTFYDYEPRTIKTVVSDGNSLTLDNVTFDKNSYILGASHVAKSPNATVTNNSVTIKNTTLNPDATIKVVLAEIQANDTNKPNEPNNLTSSNNTLNLIQSTGQIDELVNVDKINVSYDFDKPAVELPKPNTPATRAMAVRTQALGATTRGTALITFGKIISTQAPAEGGQQPVAKKPDVQVSVTGRNIPEGTVILATDNSTGGGSGGGDAGGGSGAGGSGSTNVGLGNVNVTVNGFEVQAPDTNGDYVFNLDNVKATAHSAVYSTPLAAAAQFFAMGSSLVMQEPIDHSGAFVTMGGGQNKFSKDGSSLKTKGLSVIGGWAGVVNTGSSSYTFAPIIEYGNGSYDANVAGSASGDLDYAGFGVLLKFSHDCGGFVDASARLGRTHSELNTLNGTAAMNERLNSNYVSTHARVGFRLPITASLGVTPYVRYTYSHLDSTTDSLGTLYKDFNSSVATVGVNVDGHVVESLAFTAGLGWEHEFDGEGVAQYMGKDYAPWKMKGNTGVMQLQATYAPANVKALKFDAGVEGRVGDNQGVLGRVTARYEF